MIKAGQVAHEYFRRDENGDVLEMIRALDGIDIEVSKGEFVAVLGANGSGKSTFAKHLNALLHPTEGTVYIDGIDTSDTEYTLQIRQLSGMVFQNPDNQIISNIVEEDVAFGPENMGVPLKTMKERVKSSLKSVGMYSYRKKSPNHLSGGQKQRVAIAGILAMKPQCIILDEATAMLDPVGRKQVLDTVYRLNKEEKITVVLITHFMEEAAMADRIFVMKQGKIAVQGTAREVFVQTEKLKECRVMVPDITRIAQGLNERGISVALNTLTVQELVGQLMKYAGKTGKERNPSVK